MYFTILFFILGTIFGSFYNVVGYRVPKKESLLFPSSHCTNCNNKLGPLELIPVFSYIFLKGKCKNCKQKISLFYPIIEFLGGVCFALSYVKYGISLECLISILFTSMLLIIIVSDYLTMTIPDSVLVVFGVAILIIKAIILKEEIWISILQGVCGFIFMILLKLLGDFLFKKESLGGGDIKLFFVFGLTLGFLESVFTLFLAAVIALPISLITLKKNPTHEIPFGPYLSIAAAIIMLSGINYDTILNLIIK